MIFTLQIVDLNYVAITFSRKKALLAKSPVNCDAHPNAETKSKRQTGLSNRSGKNLDADRWSRRVNFGISQPCIRPVGASLRTCGKFDLEEPPQGVLDYAGSLTEARYAVITKLD